MIMITIIKITMIILMFMNKDLVIHVRAGLECCIDANPFDKRKALKDVRVGKEEWPVIILVSLVVPQSHLNATDRIDGEPAKENKVEVKDNIHDHLDDKPGVEVDITAGGRGGRQYSVSNFIFSSF